MKHQFLAINCKNYIKEPTKDFRKQKDETSTNNIRSSKEQKNENW